MPQTCHSAPSLNIRDCINKQIMYIKSDQERMIILSWLDTSQRIGETKNFPKRRGRGVGESC